MNTGERETRLNWERRFWIVGHKDGKIGSGKNLLRGSSSLGYM